MLTKAVYSCRRGYWHIEILDTYHIEIFELIYKFHCIAKPVTCSSIYWWHEQLIRKHNYKFGRLINGQRIRYLNDVQCSAQIKYSVEVTGTLVILNINLHSFLSSCSFSLTVCSQMFSSSLIFYNDRTFYDFCTKFLRCVQFHYNFN